MRLALNVFQYQRILENQQKFLSCVAGKGFIASY